MVILVPWQTPERQTPERQTPERKTPERQTPERQTPERQIPEYAPGSEHEKIFFTFFSGNDVAPQRSTTVVLSVVLWR